MIWNKAKECMSRDELLTLQGERLVKQVKRIYYSVEYYRRKMQQEGIEPGDIRGIEDLDKLPFTTKEDLRHTYPFGHLAVPPSEIVRYHILNGTVGTKAIIGCTRNDIEIWTECMARCIYMAGIGRNDTVHIAYNNGLFKGVSGAHYGAEKVGAAVMPSPMCSTGQLIQMMKDLEVTGIMCTPTYLFHIAQAIVNMGEAGKLKLKTAICGAEQWTERMKKDVEAMLDISIYDVYGLSEPLGSGVACDCEYHKGYHVQEDFYVPEILKPGTNIAVKDGEEGELVFTTLYREGTPLLRYRTGDLTTITRERCKCGRTSARIGHFRNEADNEFIIRGVNVFGYQIENALAQLNDIHARYLIRIYREANLDMVEMLIEPCEISGAFLTEGEEIVKMRVAKAVRNVIGIAPTVRLVDEDTIPHTTGRISTVSDDRCKEVRIT